MRKDIWFYILSVIYIVVHLLNNPTYDSVDELKSYVGVCEEIDSVRVGARPSSSVTVLEMSDGTRFRMKDYVDIKREVLRKAVEDGEVFKIGYAHSFFTGTPTIVTLEISDRVKSDLGDWNRATKTSNIILICVIVLVDAVIAWLSIPPKYKRIENKNRRAKARAKKAKEKAKKKALKQ